MSQLDTDEMIERRTVHQEVNLNDLNDRVDAVEANKSADIEADSGNAAKYPSVPAVETYVATHGSGLSVEAVDALPTNAEGLHKGDRFIVSKGMEPGTIIGTCSGVSSDPNTTIINGVSIGVDAGLNAVDFAAEIVRILNLPALGYLEAAGLQSADDNGDGTFELDFFPGVFANSVVCSGTDNNPSFELTYPGSSVLQQIDQRDMDKHIRQKARPFKVLTGRLRQIGTGAPFVSDLAEDTIGADAALTFTREDVGNYNIAFTDPTPLGQGKVWFIIQAALDFGPGGGVIISYALTAGGIQITTGLADFVTPGFALQDEVLYSHHAPFELRIYDPDV